MSLEKYQPIFEEQEVRMFFLNVNLNLAVKKTLSKYVDFHFASLDLFSETAEEIEFVFSTFSSVHHSEILGTLWLVLL